MLLQFRPVDQATVFLANRTIGRAFGTLYRLSVVYRHFKVIYTFLGQYSWLKLLPVSILTAQSDNTHMVCC